LHQARLYFFFFYVCVHAAVALHLRARLCRGPLYLSKRKN
jgi:hypothetical protein